MTETTKQKVSRMFSPETLQKIDRAGLMVVDKHDFETTVNGYNEMRQNERSLKLRIKQLEAMVKKGEAK